MTNQELCKKYPFLIVRHYKTDEPVYANYEYTLLDDMPKGWKEAFGILMCEQLREVLIKSNLLYKYRVDQIKEKFGELCWYDSGGNYASDLIVRKYTDMSAKICINCGKPATKITKGYVLPYCDECIPKHINNYYNINK